MSTSFKRSLALLPMLVTAQAGTSWAASSPLGIWFDHTGRGAVEITDCNGALCGRIVWLKSASNQKACNTQIIGNVKPAGGDRWDRGWIYNPENKSKYDVEITPIGDQKLKVLGYAGTKLFSRSMTWTRAPADLQKCDKAVEVAKDKERVPEAAPAKTAGSVIAASESPAAAAAGAAEKAPPSEIASEKGPPDREESGDREARPKLCTISIRQLGSFSFPCPGSR